MLKAGGMSCSTVFPGTKSFPRHFDGVCVFHFEPSEVNFLKDVLTRYQEAPIKIFLGKSPFDKPEQYKAKSFTHDNFMAAIQHLQSEYKSLEEVMLKVFQSFDADKSGFIDIHELKQVSKELSGKAMD